MSSKANSQQTPVHWPREITKAKQQWKMEGKSEIWTKLGKFGQFRASLDKFGQDIKLEKWEKEAKRIRKGKKIEIGLLIEKIEW